jgi:hypothetical protein
LLLHAGQIQHLDLHLWLEQFRELCPLHAPFPLLRHFATTNSSEADVRDLLKESPSLRELRLLRGESDRDFSVDFPSPS